MNFRSLRPHSRATVITAERLLLFGDAVFAIAITLLALDITVPDGLADSEVGAALRDALPKVGSYLLSFAVIGTLWLSQHALFSRVARLDTWLLNLYLGLLAVVAALPFPTRLINEYGGTVAATVVYAMTITLAVGLLAAMAGRLLARSSLVAENADPRRLRDSLLRSLSTLVVFATSIPVAFLSPTAAKYWWLLVIPARRLFPGPKESDEDTAGVTGTTA
ncbi:TMEM175 family protein [Streptomyces sp. NPDC127072]|uniref:TMEM175 family protein n=1 Tax=Streptomyces sp. NPDC127072 TaxID=3347129 RepID=UPI0036576EE4